MKFTSRGFKAAAAVVATASLLGAGLLPAQAAPKTITVWADETRGPQLKSLIDGNTSIAPGYTIKVKFFSGLTALQSAWDKATAAGGPDVITGPASFNSAAKSGKVLPLLYSKAAQAEIPSGAKQALSYNGRTYGVPLDVDTTAMYWNTAFGKTAPKTIDEMYKLYTTQKAAGKVTGGICAFDGTWGAHPILTALGGGAYGFTNNSPDAKKVLINSATFKANVKKYLVGSDGKSTGFLKWDGCADEFKAGKMLAANTGAWNLSGITAAGIKFTLGAVPGLTASTKGAQWVNYSGAYVTTYAKAHGADLGARKLVTQWFASTEGQLAMSQLSKRPPASKTATAKVTDPQTLAVGRAAATGTRRTGPRTRWSW